MNELHKETSPYLLQHAENPVHWKSWNNESLDLAKNQNKLIVISIGYSACHWCHVMEHESFEGTAVAATMNSHFVNIKVDREERPDIDAVYMKAVQIMTGHGGWPLNVVALPDGRPVWGGTYFKKNQWINTLEQLQEMYIEQPEKMIEYAEKLNLGMKSIAVINQENTANFSQESILPLIQKWQKSFDLEFGGMARAPKFMMPNNYSFLLRYGYQNKNAEILDFTNLTLTKMGWGGLFDTLEGGFSRYSVDMKWHIPHFEKMLYDNGQLVSLYADAYKVTKNPLFKEVIQKTIQFVRNELSNSEGGFFSALDADSLNNKGKLEEGAYYVWEKKALENILESDFELFSQVFNINEFGYWEDNHYVLIQNQELETIAAINKIPTEVLINKKQSWEQLLLKNKSDRKKPRLDDKIITSWNAIMSKGLVDAYKALNETLYLDLAIQNMQFILERLWLPEGNLLHTYKNGKGTINGYLEDYCFTIDTLLALYEATFDENWVLKAKQMTDYCFDHFYDEGEAFFRFTSNLDQPLVTNHYEIEDNVIPASNSVMANNLFKLSIYFNNTYYENTCLKMLEKVIPNIDYPSAFSNWMNVLMNFSEQNKELAICGAEAIDYLKQINHEYRPYLVVSGTQNKSELPFLKNRFSENETVFYVCQNKACKMPSTNFEAIITLI